MGCTSALCEVSTGLRADRKDRLGGACAVVPNKLSVLPPSQCNCLAIFCNFRKGVGDDADDQPSTSRVAGNLIPSSKSWSILTS